MRLRQGVSMVSRMDITPPTSPRGAVTTPRDRRDAPVRETTSSSVELTLAGSGKSAREEGADVMR